MSDTLAAPKGTFDLPPARVGDLFLAVREALAAPLRRAGYGYVETPVFEDTALFVRGVGESTDVVSKEMYTFTDRGDRSLTLRPEGTAGVLRAVLEHGLHRGQLPVKLWYSGSFFRDERPQAGRYRHFSAGRRRGARLRRPGARRRGDRPGRRRATARSASPATACGSTRSATASAARPTARRCRTSCAGLDLDEATRARAEINPLRVLDDKRPEVQAQLADAPLMRRLTSARRAPTHYAAVTRACSTRRRRVRRRTRAWCAGSTTTRAPPSSSSHDGLGAQSAVGGGGRYDGLLAELGGPQLSGVGWALGVDRTVLACRGRGPAASARPAACDVFVVPLGDAGRARGASRWSPSCAAPACAPTWCSASAASRAR